MAEAADSSIYIHLLMTLRTLLQFLGELEDADEIEYGVVSDKIEDVIIDLSNAENHPHSHFIGIKEDLKKLKDDLKAFKETAKEEVIYRDIYLYRDLDNVHNRLSDLMRNRRDILLAQEQLQDLDVTDEEIRRLVGRRRKTRKKRKKTKRHGKKRKSRKSRRRRKSKRHGKKRKSRKSRRRRKSKRRRKSRKHNVASGVTLDDDGYYPLKTKIKLHYTQPDEFSYIVKEKPNKEHPESYLMVHSGKPGMYGTLIPVSAVHGEHAVAYKNHE